MSEKKTVNLKSPVTWITLAVCLAVGVGVGTFGNWATGGGRNEDPPGWTSGPPPPPMGNAKVSPSTSKLPRLQGKGYSIPIPEGFAVPAEEIASKATKLGGLIIMVERPRGDQFKGSVVVLPAEKLPNGESLAYLDDHARACAEVNAVPLEKAKTRVVTLPSGRVCQRVGVRPDRQNVGATLTLFHPTGADAAWSVTCDYDIHDEVAKTGCVEVLTGWRYDQEYLSPSTPSTPSSDAGLGADGSPGAGADGGPVPGRDAG